MIYVSFEENSTTIFYNKLPILVQQYFQVIVLKSYSKTSQEQFSMATLLKNVEI